MADEARDIRLSGRLQVQQALPKALVPERGRFDQRLRFCFRVRLEFLILVLKKSLGGGHVHERFVAVEESTLDSVALGVRYSRQSYCWWQTVARSPLPER